MGQQLSFMCIHCPDNAVHRTMGFICQGSRNSKRQRQWALCTHAVIFRKQTQSNPGVRRFVNTKRSTRLLLRHLEQSQAFCISRNQ